jgi:hypothetical protein
MIMATAPAILGAVRWLPICAVLLASCTQPEPQPEAAIPDPTREPWFAETVQELEALNREAEALFQRRRLEEAAALITEGQPLMARLLEAPRPTMDAVAAASDLDELYGRMLLANRHYGWARLQFQKNVARSKNWQPQTEETVRRRKHAESLIMECDRLLAR